MTPQTATVVAAPAALVNQALGAATTAARPKSPTSMSDDQSWGNWDAQEAEFPPDQRMQSNTQEAPQSLSTPKAVSDRQESTWVQAIAGPATAAETADAPGSSIQLRCR